MASLDWLVAGELSMDDLTSKGSSEAGSAFQQSMASAKKDSFMIVVRDVSCKTSCLLCPLLTLACLSLKYFVPSMAS